MIVVGGLKGLSRFLVSLVRCRLHQNSGSSREMMRERKIAVCLITFVDGARVSVAVVLDLIVCAVRSDRFEYFSRWSTRERGIRVGLDCVRSQER